MLKSTRWPYTTYGIIQSQHLVMEGVVLQCDILNLSRYQLQITIPPHKSTVVPKLIRMWTIYSSLMDQNQQIYKTWEQSNPLATRKKTRQSTPI
jgi:hypothetical protein